MKKKLNLIVNVIYKQQEEKKKQKDLEKKNDFYKVKIGHQRIGFVENWFRIALKSNSMVKHKDNKHIM